MKITLKAMKTGIIEDRQGSEVGRIIPISKTKDPKLRAAAEEMAARVKKVNNLIMRMQEYDNNKRDIITEIDRARDGIIGTLNGIWRRFEISTLPIPTEITDSTDVWERFP